MPETGTLGFASAGRVGGLLLSPDGHLVLPNGGPPLGSDPELLVVQPEQLIKPGSALLVYSDGVVATTDAHGLPWDERTLAEFLRRLLHLSADELIARLQTALGVATEFERTLLVVKRLR